MKLVSKVWNAERVPRLRFSNVRKIFFQWLEEWTEVTELAEVRGRMSAGGFPGVGNGQR